MTTVEKRGIITYLLKNQNLSYITYAEYLDKAGILKRDYNKYMTTVPVNLDLELSKRYDADYDTICALLSAVLKEAEMVHYKFEERKSKGILNDLLIRILVETYICEKTPTYRFFFHIISLRLLAYGFSHGKIIKFMQKNEHIIKESFAYNRLAYNEDLITERQFRLAIIDDIAQTVSDMIKEEDKNNHDNQIKQMQLDALEYTF